MNWWALGGAALAGLPLASYMQMSRIEGYLFVAGIWLLANCRELRAWERRS